MHLLIIIRLISHLILTSIIVLILFPFWLSILWISWPALELEAWFSDYSSQPQPIQHIMSSWCDRSFPFHPGVLSWPIALSSFSLHLTAAWTSSSPLTSRVRLWIYFGYFPLSHWRTLAPAQPTNEDLLLLHNSYTIWKSWQVNDRQHIMGCTRGRVVHYSYGVGKGLLFSYWHNP